MLRNVKSILCVTLSAVLIAASLSGCGNGGSSSGTQSATTQAAATASSEETKPAETTAPTESAETTAAETEAEAPVVDLKGKEIHLQAWSDGFWHLSEDSTNKEDHVRFERMKEMEEKYNCKFVIDVIESSGAILSALRAGEMADTPSGEIMFMNAVDIISAYKAGLLLDLSQFIDASSSCFNKTGTEFLMQDDGSYYTGSVGNTLHSSTCFVVFNKDLFESQGIDVDALYQDALDGKWTFDRLMEVAQQATVMGDGGVPEVYGMGLRNVESTWQCVAVAYDTDGAIRNDDGTYSSGFGTEKMNNALETMQKMYTSEYFRAPQDGDDWGGYFKLFTEGKVAMLYNGNGASGIYGEICANAPFEVGALPNPKPSEDGDYIYGEGTFSGIVMPASYGNDPETAQAIWDMFKYIYETDESKLLDNERKFYETFCSDEAMVEILLQPCVADSYHIRGINAFNIGLTGQFYDLVGPALKDIMSGTLSVKAGTDVFADAWEQLIEEYNAAE